MIIKTKRIKVDTAGLSVRVAEGRLQFSLDGFFIRFPLFGEAFYSKDIGWVRKPWREVRDVINSWGSKIPLPEGTPMSLISPCSSRSPC